MPFQTKAFSDRHLMNINFSTGLDFIRAEGFVFSHVADEGLLNACAGELLRYRRCMEQSIFRSLQTSRRSTGMIRYEYVAATGCHRALKEAQHSVVVSVLLCHMITCVIFENGRTVLMP